MKELIAAVVLVAIVAYLLCTTVNMPTAKDDESQRRTPVSAVGATKPTARSPSRDDGSIASRWNSGSGEQTDLIVPLSKSGPTLVGNTPAPGIGWIPIPWSSGPFVSTDSPLTEKRATDNASSPTPTPSPGSIAARWNSRSNGQPRLTVSGSPEPTASSSPAFNDGSVAGRWIPKPR